MIITITGYCLVLNIYNPNMKQRQFLNQILISLSKGTTQTRLSFAVKLNVDNGFKDSLYKPIFLQVQPGVPNVLSEGCLSPHITAQLVITGGLLKFLGQQGTYIPFPILSHFSHGSLGPHVLCPTLFFVAGGGEETLTKNRLEEEMIYFSLYFR